MQVHCLSVSGSVTDNSRHKPGQSGWQKTVLLLLTFNAFYVAEHRMDLRLLIVIPTVNTYGEIEVLGRSCNWHVKSVLENDVACGCADQIVADVLRIASDTDRFNNSKERRILNLV